MRLFWETIRSDLEKLHRDGVRLRHLGRLQDLSPDIQKAVEGLQNGVRANLDDALNHIPPEDWHAEITNRQKESDGQTLIWLAGRSDPSYSIQE